MRLFVALVLVVLFCCAAAVHAPSVSAHACASPHPPAVPGSPLPAPAIPGILRINEVLAVPGSTWNCSESGTYFLATDAWLELYNPQNQPFNLYAAHASIDSGPNSYAYYLPFGAAIAAHGFLVLFPNVNSQTLIDRATVRLLINTVTIDQVSIPALAADQSYARIPDGANNWRITSTPTIDASNTSSQLTPTPLPTTSPTSSTSGSGSSIGGQSHGSATSSSHAGTLVNGTQPEWNALQLPASTSTSVSTPTTDEQLTTAASSAPPINGQDVPRRILMTLVAVAFVVMLFWCWRLFTSP